MSYQNHVKTTINREFNSIKVVLSSPPSENIFSKEKQNKLVGHIQNSSDFEIVESQEKSKQIVDNLKKLNNLEDVVKIAGKCFAEKQNLFNHLTQLIGFYDDEDGEISVESLKSMLIFFSVKGKFSSPSMTLNEDGTFQVNWRKDNLNLITLRFRNENFVDFLIFKSSQYTEKPIISNGNSTVFDFIEDVKKLNLIYLIESELNG